jgi:predicted DNA-binding protein
MKRKLIDLPYEAIEKLQALADKQNRSLKNYIETVLIEHVKELNKKR